MGAGIRRLASTTLVAAALAGPAAPSTAAAAPLDGGTVARGNDGGSLVGDRRLRPTLIRALSLRPATVRRDRPLRVAIRLGGPPRAARGVVELRRGGRRVARIPLGRLRAGRTVVRRWTGTRRLAAGTYAVRALVVDRAGEPARAASRGAARASLRVVDPPRPRPRPAPDTPAPSGSGAFPVAGPYTLGGDGGRFGADRGDHVHQGQDIGAAEGTPVVAPRAGTVVVRAFQAEGAGNYLVVRGDRDYVFMHLQDGSISVGVGDRVRAGQRLAGVGSTGRSSGPHLHFEIWVGAWQGGGRPIDPLPDLLRWAR